jgi:hypothetical protein
VLALGHPSPGPTGALGSTNAPEPERIDCALEIGRAWVHRPSNADALGLADLDAELKRILRETLRTMPRRPSE